MPSRRGSSTDCLVVSEPLLVRGHPTHVVLVEARSQRSLEP